MAISVTVGSSRTLLRVIAEWWDQTGECTGSGRMALVSPCRGMRVLPHANGRDEMETARRVGLGAIAVAAVAVWFVLAPEATTGPTVNLTTIDYVDLIDTALSDYDANDERADTAPKQQVVNGWVARDLLWISTLQNVDLLEAIGALADQNSGLSDAVAATDDRIPALLVLTVVAVCWLGITTPLPEAVASRSRTSSNKLDVSQEAGLDGIGE